MAIVSATSQRQQDIITTVYYKHIYQFHAVSMFRKLSCLKKWMNTAASGTQEFS